MLFSEEAKLKGQIRGTTGFAAEFQKGGVRDSAGRSLRDFDLKTRLFRYPLSYLIYTEQFDALPDVVRNRLRQRLGEVLRGDNPGPKFAHLSPADKAAILEIVKKTKADLYQEASN
jgi:hypothetical protein